MFVGKHSALLVREGLIWTVCSVSSSAICSSEIRMQEFTNFALNGKGVKNGIIDIPPKR
jgi:hypothetical protein